MSMFFFWKPDKEHIQYPKNHVTNQLLTYEETTHAWLNCGDNIFGEVIGKFLK